MTVYNFSLIVDFMSKTYLLMKKLFQYVDNTVCYVTILCVSNKQQVYTVKLKDYLKGLVQVHIH